MPVIALTSPVIALPVGVKVKVTSVGWQITLCDPTDKWRPVVLR